MKVENPVGRLVHVERMKVRWGDMDALDHVNNTIYFRYLEQARLSWFGELGYLYRGAEEGAMLGQVACRFLRSVAYPAEIDVSVYASQPGRSSFRLQSAIVDAADPAVVYALGDAAMVWINLATGRSTPLPERLRALCEAG